MTANRNHIKKLFVCLLTVGMSFCVLTTPVKASMPIWDEIQNWGIIARNLRGCKLNYADDNGTVYRLSSSLYSQFMEFVNRNDYEDAIKVLGTVYLNPDHTDSNWRAVDCAKKQKGNEFAIALDEFVASNTGSVIDYNTENWWFFTETIMIVGACTGLVVYKKKKHPQKS